MQNKLITKTDKALNHIGAAMIAIGTFIVYLLLTVPYAFYKAFRKSHKAYRKARKYSYPVKHIL